MAGVAGRSGGARAGAGKPKAAKYAAVVERMDRRIAKNLPERLAAIEKIAEGAGETVTEIWEPAYSLRIDTYLDLMDENGDLTGKRIKVFMPAFPELPGETMVLTRRTVTSFAPNLAANMYLIDRIAGKPIPAPETEEEEADPIEPYDLAKLTGEEAAILGDLLEKASLAQPVAGGSVSA